MYISHGLDVTSARSFSYICQPGARVGFDGPMAEWLGSALQKLLQRFESASDLQLSRSPKQPLGVFFVRSGEAQTCLRLVEEVNTLGL